MADFSISNVAVKGMTACVPKDHVVNTQASVAGLDNSEMLKVVAMTGIDKHHLSPSHICTSDLCFEAATKLIDQLNWSKEDIEIVIFVSQTPDYILPMTSAILQQRLGLSTHCLAFDMSIGCSGFVYGMSVISSLMSAGKIKKGLLLVGDTITKLISKQDRSTFPLFGDAGTATALAYDENAEEINFSLSTDGSGYKAIIVHDGGQRSPFTEQSLLPQSFEGGIERSQHQLNLNGMDVFNFSISKAPASFQQMMSATHKTIDAFDYFVFHQANKLMNETIRKKLKIDPTKYLYSLQKYGNTSSATIPLTLVSELQAELGHRKLSLGLCGFGVGLSWGSMSLVTDHIVTLPVIEL